jgi:hypothetical protein
MENVTSTSTPAQPATPTTEKSEFSKFLALLDKVAKMGEEEVNTLIKEVESIFENKKAPPKA